MIDRLRACSVFLVICIALALNFYFGIYTAVAASYTMVAEGNNSRVQHQITRDDTRLTNSCIEAGQTKTHCLCVTSIYKHQFSQGEYKAAIAMYVAENTITPKTLKADNKTDITRVYTGRQVREINAKRRDMTKPEAFEQNCRAAQAYFSS